MLEFRGYKEDEVQQINDILINEGINEMKLSDKILVVVEDNIVLGLCKVEIRNLNSKLKYLIIKENSRGQRLGDGLLRTIINKLDLQGIEKMFYDKIDLYLLRKGFMENKDGILELNILHSYLILVYLRLYSLLIYLNM